MATLTERNRPYLVQRRLVNDLKRAIAENRAYTPTSEPGKGPGIPVTLAGPWKNREVAKIMKAWNIPASHEDLENLVHRSSGGWGTFAFPSMPEAYAYIAKASKHVDSPTYLALIARVALFSQLTLSEALTLALDCAKAEPRREYGPREWANDWIRHTIVAINVW